LEPILIRSYGSILPTSLIYIVLSTRGCSPWRPAAVMSTTWRETIPSRGFSRVVGGAPDPQRVIGRQEEKRTLPRTPPTSPRSVTLPWRIHIQVPEY
ncbi:hypothetical protein BO70DRAFT_408014, partial [Aspergillus heteromorphus CBS 117.55]